MLNEDFLSELDRETPPARILMERLPSERLDWRPHANSRTLAELAWHMASIPAVVSEIVQHPEQDRTQVPWPQRPATVSDMLAGFDRNLETAHANLRKLDDAELGGTLRMNAGGRQLFAMPRKQFVRWGMLTHFVHHRAQLGLYLRMLEVPVPALVGPSLDDNPFAPKP